VLGFWDLLVNAAAKPSQHLIQRFEILSTLIDVLRRTVDPYGNSDCLTSLLQRLTLELGGLPGLTKHQRQPGAGWPAMPSRLSGAHAVYPETGNPALRSHPYQIEQAGDVDQNCQRGSACKA